MHIYNKIVFGMSPSIAFCLNLSTGLSFIWLKKWWGDRIWRVCSSSERLPSSSAPSTKSSLYMIDYSPLSVYACACHSEINCLICIKSLHIFDVAVAFRLYDIWQRGFIERDEVDNGILSLYISPYGQASVLQDSSIWQIITWKMLDSQILVFFFL